jgi:hypothetical protein
LHAGKIDRLLHGEWSRSLRDTYAAGKQQQDGRQASYEKNDSARPLECE